MEHHHHHHHHHHHSHHHGDISGAKLLWSVLLNLLITLAQLVGGILSGSLALLSDALHNFSDVASLIITYYAHRLSHRPNTLRQTFGFKRAEIIAALFNASVLIAVSLYLIIESIDHLLHPRPVASEWVIALAALGIIVNGGSAWLLHRDSAHSLNVRSAYLHLMGDLMTSVAVLAGGAVMYVWGWIWIDAVLSLLISLYLIRSSYGIIREATGMLMQFAPEEVSVETIIEAAQAFDAVESIQHIHLWQLDEGSVFLEARLNFHADLCISEADEVMHDLAHALETHGVTHTTFQPQFGIRGGESVCRECCGH